MRINADAIQLCNEMLEPGDALRHYMLPWLGLRNVVQFAGACRACRQLIMDTSLHELSEEARAIVLPSELTSRLPLLQLVKQQAQLMARLKGKHGFTPRIQRLSFADDLIEGRQQGIAGQCDPAPHQFQKTFWSPCDRLEDASRWLVLRPHEGCKRLPIVLDTDTERQVCFEMGSLPMRLIPNSISLLDAAWLMDKSGRILIFQPQGQIHGSIACLADARSRTTLPFGTSGAQSRGTSHFFTVRSKEAPALDILCGVPELEHGTSSEDYISVYDASSRQLLYQLSFPQLHWFYVRLQHTASSQAQHLASEQQLAHAITVVRNVLLAPNKKLLAVLWRFCLKWPPDANRQVDLCVGLRVHSAIRADPQHDMLLKDVEGCGQPDWLPCSSNMMYVSAGGVLHSMTSGGCMLWSSARDSRNPDQSTHPAKQSAATRLNASPCGRWILVMDIIQCVCLGIPQPTEHVTIVEASTGRNLAGYRADRSISGLEGRWSMSGQVCLLEQLSRVLVCCPQANQACTIFQQYELSGSASVQHLSLSPCGSTVIGLDNSRDTGLQHWQIPPSSSIVREAASASQTLQPSICTDFSSGRQSSGTLQEAWHSTCIYAISCTRGGVHLIDARANRCVQSWTEDELHGPACPLGSEGMPSSQHANDTSSADASQYDSNDHGRDGNRGCVPRALSWSKDGCRLAIASGASLTRGARCCVLHFSESSS